MLEENEDNRKMVERMSEGSDAEMEQQLQNHRTACREVLGWSQEQVEMMERGLRRAVEAKRKGRSEEQEQRRQDEQDQRRQGEQGRNLGQEQSKQGKEVRFGEDEQLEETRAESTDELEVTGRLAEVRTGRGSAGLVRGRDERRWSDETSTKGRGKGNWRKGEHGSKGGVGRKGTQQVENSVMDEDQESEEREDQREQRAEGPDEEKHHEEYCERGDEERVRMAPNMGAGGSHPKAMTDPERACVKFKC